jgi:chemotaxis protein methyltransferase CheR
MLKIAPSELKVFASFIQEISGISLDQSKAYLVETRLSNLAQELGCVSFSELYYKAKADISLKVARKIIDAITTKETMWFRDNSPFELLRHKILPELIDRKVLKPGGPGKKGIKIWSAACSTGQEVYSLAIIIKELLPDWSRYGITILGTDLSDEAITRASYGEYNQFEIERGLPREKLERYFTKNGQNTWKIKDEPRGLATFRRQNLLESFLSLGTFDVILCRNVAIYFTPEDKAKLFQKIAQALEPDGYLIIGSTESLPGISPDFEPQRHLNSIFYQRKNQAARPELAMGQ